MDSQAVDLLADIATRDEEGDFLGKPRVIDRGFVDEITDSPVKETAQAFGLAASLVMRSRNEVVDVIEQTTDDSRQTGAFAEAGCHQAIENRLKVGGEFIRGRAGTCCSHNADHPPHRKQPGQRRRRRSARALFHDTDEVIESGVVHHHIRPLITVQLQGKLNGAPRHHAPGPFARHGLKPLETAWNPAAHIKALAVDTACIPCPGAAGHTGDTRHTLKCHEPPPTWAHATGDIMGPSPVSLLPHNAMIRPPSSILVTGASSGIGAALARLYAAPDITLFLGGRDGPRLAAVAQDCREAGACCTVEAVDVTDRDAMTGWVAHCNSARALDLVIANAGVSAGSGDTGESAEQVHHLLRVNVDGVFNTVLPAMQMMVTRGQGQIAVMSSLASFRGFPGAPAYCASKAALRLWGEGQRVWLRQHHVRLSFICPGFVETPMSRGNPYSMPFLMDADRAARLIRKGLERDRARIAFPWQTWWLVQLLAVLPPVLTDRLLSRMPSKPAAADNDVAR